MQFLRRQRHLILFASVAILMMGIVGFFLLQMKQEDEWAPLTAETTSASTSQTVAEPVEIVVDIKGQVVKPGVYQLPPDSRLNTLVALAGGLTAEADQKQLNLAMKLVDQQMIYVPHADEQVTTAAVGSVVPQGDSGQINLNTADSSQLQELSGIGEKKAQAIIDYREEHGSFKSVDELTEVAGIGEKTLEKLRDDLTV